MEEAMRLVEFQTQDGETVLINPDQVRSVRAQGTGSRIELDVDYFISVTTRVQAARGMLANEEEV
jgi:hypothetical protein